MFLKIYNFAFMKNSNTINREALAIEAIKKYKITYPVAYDFESFGQERVSEVSQEQMNKAQLRQNTDYIERFAQIW